MNAEYNEILNYLDNCYTGAMMIDDYPMATRIARAIAAFQGDPEKDSSEIFTKEFINWYYDKVCGLRDNDVR